MPCIEYVSRRFGYDAIEIIEAANRMLEDFADDGLIVTLRQLYYRFVASDLIPNTKQSYKRFGSIINDARLAGMIDWDAIEDRVRELMHHPHWETPYDIVKSCATQFKIDKWKDQKCRVEVWVEKEALESVVGLAASALDCAYFACKGYCSQSEMWRASQRFLEYNRAGQLPVVLYLGDHDPSGIDMTRDVSDRLNKIFGVNVYVHRLALNMKQVEHHRPPPNPAKITDSRAEGYIEKFGDKSWELDALSPRVLREMIQSAIRAVMEKDKFEAAEALERRHLALLRAIADNWPEIEKTYAPPAPPPSPKPQRKATKKPAAKKKGKR